MTGRPHEDKRSALDRAEEIQARMPLSPTFLKVICRSHVNGKKSLQLPRHFHNHLPKGVDEVTLENEKGERHYSRYYPYYLSNKGWGSFCRAHSLRPGDVLVFRLVNPTKFKVYIVKSYYCSSKVNDDLGWWWPSGKDAGGGKRHLKSSKVGCISGSEDNEEGDGYEDEEETMYYSPGNYSCYDTYEDACLTAPKVLKRSTEFKEVVKSLDDFNVVMHDGSAINLPEEIRGKYYKLCTSQNSFLHQKVDANGDLVKLLILDCVQMVDEISACKPSSSLFLEKLKIWDGMLEASEKSGMNVGFIRDRVKRLLSYANQSRSLFDAIREKAALADEVAAAMQEEINAYKEKAKKIDSDMEVLKEDLEKHEAKFLEEAAIPW